MTCNYCSYKLSMTYNLSNSNVYCMNCGFKNTGHVLYAKYVGKNRGEHYFDVNEEFLFDCESCGTEMNRLTIPCGGNYYIQVNTKEDEIEYNKFQYEYR